MSPLEATVRAGLAWLYDTEQPDDAVLTHHGALLAVPGLTPPASRRIGLVPQGFGAGCALVTIGAPDARWDGIAGVWHDPLAVGELDALRVLVEQLGHQVVDQWNGDGLNTGSLALHRTAHPTLIAAVRRYSAGCPTHHTVFCSSDGCTWYATGRRRVIDPTPPVGDGTPEQTAATVTR